ncbi:C-type lectin domain family 4 member F-like isoform X1 [Drosophila rhopaloa]|uniref:C-type lectin domain family 4 member F-like isoform X1 n=1 Tax=Drosophila rhopaloa TaxID=1041015 RepID=A0A6P4EB76_DRORH|nr:C-type lectin domain family 4 member F-like isoform X1 [Drosophila rhopaloa]
MKHIFLVFLFSLLLQRSMTTILTGEKMKAQDCSSYISESVIIILEHMVVMNERIKKLEGFSSEFENFKKDFTNINQISNVNLQIRLENRTAEVLSENSKITEMVQRLQTDFSLQKENLKSLEEITKEKLESQDNKLTADGASKAAEINKLSTRFDSMDTQIAGQQKKIDLLQVELNEKLKTIEKLESQDNKLTADGANKAAEINKLSTRFDSMDTQIAGQQKKIDLLQVELNEKLKPIDGLRKFEDLTTKQMEAAIKKINVAIRTLAYMKIGSKLYYIEETEKRNWYDSRAFCLDFGGHLVSPQSQSELDALGKKLKKGENLYWTDIQDFSTEGVFISDTTGEKPKFINWRQEPDNWYNEDCVEIKFLNEWSMNDNDCYSRINFVCESQLV